ncbi:hypothetical protein L916_10271 [Phytophthora nicotianae]|uniref:Uncharacterized protein n=1 Tax=Phytophthora nicotianae TaxID=4792 RepID=W2IVG5_PHYNI|nr:hypothetical protein L916_10271 [Phytophthora nicotianae]
MQVPSIHTSSTTLRAADRHENGVKDVITGVLNVRREKVRVELEPVGVGQVGAHDEKEEIEAEERQNAP